MSTTEERAQMLYDKALTKLNTYLKNMKTKPPQEIINSAYQIVKVMAYDDFERSASGTQCAERTGASSASAV